MAAGTLDVFNDFVTAIQQQIAIKAANYESATFKVADGESEAMYGWISANYALGLLEQEPAATKGFLEMGGASLQVAYEIATATPGRNMPLSINYGALHRNFKVYVREIDDLGANEARKKYLSRMVVNNPTIDRSWPLNARLLAPNENIVGTGLRRALTNDGSFGGQLVDSLYQVARLFPPGLRMRNHPPLDPDMTFLGGGAFWHLSRGIYPTGIKPADRYDQMDLTTVILDFATIPWDPHFASERTTATATVNAMSEVQVNDTRITGENLVQKRADLINQRVMSETKHKIGLLFNALLVYATLFVRIKIGVRALFQPYNGVVQRNAVDVPEKVPYSWTLGRALLHATGSTDPVAVRTPAVLVSTTLIADRDWNLGRTRGVRCCEVSLRALPTWYYWVMCLLRAVRHDRMLLVSLSAIHIFRANFFTPFRCSFSFQSRLNVFHFFLFTLRRSLFANLHHWLF